MRKPRTADAKVDHLQAANCRALGMTLAQIREAIAPGVSLMAVSRALKRARKLEAANAKPPCQ
jgi:hypothetical protein